MLQAQVQTQVAPVAMLYPYEHVLPCTTHLLLGTAVALPPFDAPAALLRLTANCWAASRQVRNMSCVNSAATSGCLPGQETMS